MTVILPFVSHESFYNFSVMTTNPSALSLSALALTGQLSEMLSMLLLLTHAYVYNAHFYEGAPCDQEDFKERTQNRLLSSQKISCKSHMHCILRSV